MPQTTTAKIRWSAMDGIRAISIVFVMLVHLQLPHVQGGVVGVDVFFVLSGFLITALLIGELDKRSAVSLRNFYIRRALRLFPALALAIGLAGAVCLAGEAHGLGHLTLTGLPWVVFYVGDIARAVGSPAELGLLGTTWSLAVEEQFYLIWPFVFLLIMRRNPGRERVAIVLALVAVAEMIYRVILVHAGISLQRITYSPDTRSDGLLLGCGLAFWLSSRQGQGFSYKATRIFQVVTGVGIVAMAVVVLKGAGNLAKTFEIGIPITIVATAVIVATIIMCPIAPLNRVLELPPLVWLGRRSYGLYLVHYPIFVAVRANGGPHSHQILGVVLSVIVAALSFWLWETPWLRLKVRFQRTEAYPILDAVD